MSSNAIFSGPVPGPFSEDRARSRRAPWLGWIAVCWLAGITAAQAAAGPLQVYRDGRPYVRWWWFSGPIAEKDICEQLDWLKKSGFGGVEISWVYPQENAPPGPAWLSAEWSQRVAFARRYARRLGLGCDFTLGTLWPFGDSGISESDASLTFRGPSEQRIRRSWEQRTAPPARVLNHLDQSALKRYFDRVGGALRPALQVGPLALFCDSWEVETEGLWAAGLDQEFRRRFGYDLVPYMADLNAHAGVRYDYRKLISEVIIREFYRPFTRLAHERGGLSRVQCMGSPTDLQEAYAAVDVPESEAVLFDPAFSRIAASTAALTGKPVVSAEAFTCLYGWKRWPGPAPFLKQEQLGDLKLVADALLANGVNLLVWHGMPYNPQGGKNEFYASVHVGPDTPLAIHFPAFNRYLKRLSEEMRQGQPYTDLAVYLPVEDNRMKNELPPERQRPSAAYYWEMQYQRFPAALHGYRPTWVSAAFLEQARFTDGFLRIGPARFSALYLDAEWLDREALPHIVRLAREGLPVCLPKRPSQPGRNTDPSYARLLDELQALPNVSSDLTKRIGHPPLLEGENLPEFAVRRSGDRLTIFFAHPLTWKIQYPLTYGQSFSAGTTEVRTLLNYGGRRIPLALRFAPNQSLLLRVSAKGELRWEDVTLPCPVPRTAPESR